MPLSEFFQISGEWSELELLNLVWMSLTKSYLLLQNPRFTVFTVSELWTENHQGGGGGGGVKISPQPSKLGLMESPLMNRDWFRSKSFPYDNCRLIWLKHFNTARVLFYDQEYGS